MNTTTTTQTTPTAQPTSAATPAPASARRAPRRLRRRLAALVLVLASVAGFGTVTATSASASTPSITLSANCNYRSISAEAPDLHWWGAGWAVSYRFKVWEYNTSGWVLRQVYPSSGYLSTRSGLGMGNDVFTFSARSGYAYNVSIEMYWYYNGIYQGYQYQSEIHSVSGIYVSPSSTWCRVQ